MIDVPVLVKDALRNGRLKKNYRFVLGEEEWHEVGSFETIGWYSPSTSYGDDKKYTIRDTKTYRFVVDDADHDTYTLYIYKGTDPNWRTVEATSRNTWDITLINESYAYVEIKSSSGNYYSPVSVQNFFAYTIDNNNLVSESVSIDERMCSGDTLKFGLCEGSSLEFQYFDFPNITGQRIQALVDVESEEMEYLKIRELKRSLYSLPADGRYKITATAENMANIFALFFVHGTTTTRMEFTVAQDGHGEIEIPNAKRNDGIYLSYRSGTTPTAEVFQWVHKWHTIPLGFFDVKKCSRQASTGIIKATAYNKLQSEYLDAKANNLVVDAFDDKGSIVTIYDIKRIALNKYSIDPAEINTILPHTTGSLTPLDDGVSGTKWNVFVRDNGPISLFDFGFYSLPSSVKFAFAGDDMCIYTLDPNKYYRIDCEYNLDDYEKSFLSYLMEVVEKANLNVNSYDYLMSCIRNMYLPSSPNTYKTWKFFFSIELTDRNGNKEYYSIVCKENGVSVNGTMNDLKLRLIHGYTEMHVYTPRAMGAYTNNILDITTKSFSFAGDSDGSGKITYHYNDTQYTTVTNQYPAFKKPNGMPFSNGWVNPLEFLSLVEVSGLSNADLITVKVNEMPDYTLRNLVDATFETVCQFGQLDRVTDLFAGVELNRSRLYPAEALYPSDTLYPSGAAASGFKSMYSKLWADEGNIHKWRYLIITYKGLNGDSQEEDYTLQRTVNADGTDDYNMSDNWIFKNLVWTAEQVGAYADAMVLKMRDITWFPFEMWCAGLPYLETGDEIEIPLGEETYTSYILQRQLKGIQNLQDTYINGTLDIF